MLMRNWQIEINKRVEFIKSRISEAKAEGIVYGNSGGKDCALVGILARLATKNVTAVIMPCGSKSNYNQDRIDALKVCEKFDIAHIEVDLTDVKKTLTQNISKAEKITDAALTNIAPRLRMTTLYAVAQSKNCLVAGTGNASEAFMGYFTKWGDGAYDFDVIADLTVTEIYEFLRYLDAPESVITKAPSAGLFEGQTDEGEMGVTYREIDEYITTGKTNAESAEIIEKYHARSEHKRRLPYRYGIDK